MQFGTVLVSVFFAIFLTMGSYWTFVFLNRLYRFRKYKKVAARHSSTSEDSDNIFKQYCYHYETEIQKLAYLLLINLTEVYGVIMSIVSYSVGKKYSTLSGMEGRQLMSKCSNVNSSALNDFQFEQTNMVANELGSVFQVADLFVVMLGVSLMSYLTERIKQIQCPPCKAKRWAFAIFTCLISLVIIAISFIHPSLLYTIIFPITLLVYFCIFLRSANQFGRTLLQRAGERLAQFGSNKEEYQQYKYFKYTMRIICFGFMLIVVSIYLFRFPEFLTSILFYQKCYFPLNLLPHYNSIMTVESIEILITILSQSISLGYHLGNLGAVVAFSPFVCITFSIWIKEVCDIIRRKQKYTYRYHTEEFYESLLSDE